MRCSTFACLLAGSLATPAVAAKSDVKVGYVDMARAVQTVNDGKKAKAKLKSDFEAKQKKLDEMQKGLKKKKEDFEKKASMMKADARQRKQEELQREFLELQQTYMQLQKELIDEETRVMQDIGAKLRKTIAKLGDRDNYHMILDIGETVLYYKRHQDVTDDVIKEYNRNYGNGK